MIGIFVVPSSIILSIHLIMYAVFLVCLPFGVLLLFLVYYCIICYHSEYSFQLFLHHCSAIFLFFCMLRISAVIFLYLVVPFGISGIVSICCIW